MLSLPAGIAGGTGPVEGQGCPGGGLGELVLVDLPYEKWMFHHENHRKMVKTIGKA
jgi:hypothetical protein